MLTAPQVLAAVLFGGTAGSLCAIVTWRVIERRLKPLRDRLWLLERRFDTFLGPRTANLVNQRVIDELDKEQRHVHH
jgi:hypothetical protein